MAAVLQQTRAGALSCVSFSFRHVAKRSYRYNVMKTDKMQAMTYEDDVYFLRTRLRPRHTLSEALETLRCYSFFHHGTITLHMKINPGDSKKRFADISQVRGICVFPKAFGKSKKLLVFAEGEQAQIAKENGVETVGGEEIFHLVEEGKLQFDHCLATLDMAKKLKPLQRILKEKVPNTKRGTATDDLAPVIATLRRGQNYKSDREGKMYIPIGKLSYSDTEIKENALQAVGAVEKHRLITKGKFFQSLVVSSSGGPSFHLHLKELLPNYK